MGDDFGALNDTYEIVLMQKQVWFRISGTWVGTIIVEGCMDKLEGWSTVDVYNYDTKATVSSMTVNGLFTFTRLGFFHFRLRMSAFTSGTAHIEVLPESIDPTGTTTQAVSAASLPLPSGASTEATLALIKAKTDNLDVLLSTRTKPADTQAISAANLPLPSGAATAALQLPAGHTVDVTDRAARDLGKVSGNVAHDAVDSGNPLKVGGIARIANPTAVAALDRVDAWYDKTGKQIVVPYAPRELEVDNTITLTSTTETTLLAAGAAGVFHDLTLIVITNTSATDVRVDVRSATAGAVRFSFLAKAGLTVGFAPPFPVNQTAAANNWTAQLASAVTDVRIFAQAVKNV